MSEAAAADSESDRLLDVVVDILETEGYDAVQLREVARRARTSLATIYKRYPTRDDLILGALSSIGRGSIATRIYPPRPPKRRSTKR